MPSTKSLKEEENPEVNITRLKFEHLQDALGMGTAEPRLSWITETIQKNWRQSGYEVEAYLADGTLGETTGRVESVESVLVPWPFKPLASRDRRLIRVRVWGFDDSPSNWSELVPVQTGLLQATDWQARFITPDWDENISLPQPLPFLRREFELSQAVRQARLYITALGVYEAQINGVRVGDQVLAPGWTSYKHRLRYQTYDVTDLLRPGRNAVGAILGDGWFRGRLGFHGGQRNIYGQRLALLAQLEVEYADGSIQHIITEQGWKATTGPLLASDIYDGETYDARLELAGWSTAGYNDQDWSGVRLLDRNLDTLVAPTGPPVRRIELVSPVAITKSPSGRTIVDFGQNLVGRIRIKLRGDAGQTVTIRHAEVLEEGELCTRPLRFAKATDQYTLKGGELETWEPRFTFHGFRFAEVAGWTGELQAANLQAVVCHSDMERTGWFECSDPLVNRLHENVVWSMRGNFLDIPTDCPQRDERLGWTGDIQVFAPTASFLYDSAGFLASWLADLAAEQKDAGGNVPFFVPNVMADPPSPAAAWGDAAVIVPWVLYQRFGDKQILVGQFESMRMWVDLIAEVAGENRLWEKGIQFGDWLDPKAPPNKPGDARTAPNVVATAYFARSSELLGRAAGVIGKKEAEARYLDLAGEVREAFAREYVTPAGRIVSDAATAYTLALQFSLLADPAQRKRAGERLAALVRGSGYHISTGFVGTPLICDALCEAGAYEAAYRLLLQRENPSWLYPVTMGATTIWERWDSMLPDGSINPGQMTSFNHYALGAVADWLHRTVAGLAPAEPGYRRMNFHPQPGGSLTYALARHRTPYGMAACSWKIEQGMMTVEVEVPPNTTANVVLPGERDQSLEIGSGKYHWAYPYQQQMKSRPVLTLESTLGELIDHPEAYSRVMQVFIEHNEEFADRMDGQLEITLLEAIAINPRPEELTAKIKSVLASY